MSPSSRPEVTALLQAAKEQPEEDAPRLILADWLEEHGSRRDQARVDLLRWQCALDRRQAINGWTPSELRRRTDALLKKHRAALLAPFRTLGDAVGKDWQFHRGLVRAAIDSKHFPEELPASRAIMDASAWLEELTLSELILAQVERLAAWPCLTQLRKLDLWIKYDHQAHTEVVRAVAALSSSPYLKGLQHLRLSVYDLDPPLSDWLSPSTFPSLRTLEISSLDGEARATLADTPILEQLRSLDVRRVGDDEAKALARSPRVGRLEHLSFTLPASGKQE